MLHRFSVILFMSCFFTITALNAKTFYWVGNGGNWSDSSDSTANWSLTSGGPGYQGHPGSSDTAYFDYNSFTTNYQAVSLTGSVHIGSIICQGINPNYYNWLSSSDQSTDTIYMNGSLVLNQSFSISLYNTLFLFNSSSLNNVINSNGSYLGQFTFQFTGGGTWTLQNDFSFYGEIDVLGGATFSTAGYNLSASTIKDSLGTLIISNRSNVSVQKWNFNAVKGSTLKMDTTATITLTQVNDDKLRGVQWSAPTSYFFGGNQKYGNVNFSSGTYIYGKNSIDTLTIAAGDTLVIPNNEEQKFNYLIDHASANSSSNQYSNNIAAIFAGDSTTKTQTALTCMKAAKFPFSYTNLHNIKLQGATYYAFGGQYSNSSGYTIVDSLISNGVPVLVDSSKCKLPGTAVIALSAKPTGGVEPYTYTWTGMDNSTYTYSDTTVVNSDTLKGARSNTTYYVSVSDASGQSIVGSSASPMVNTKYITDSIGSPYVLPLAVICHGSPDSIPIYASATNNVTYTWSPFDKTVAKGNNFITGLTDTIYVKPTATTTYTVTLQSTNRCVQTYTIPVKVENPVAAVKSSQINVCVGTTLDSTLLDASQSSGVVNPPYWSNNFRQLPTLAQPEVGGVEPLQQTYPNSLKINVPISIVGSTTYQLLLQGDNNCSSTATVTVTVFDSIRNPNIVLGSLSDTLCNPSNGNYNVKLIAVSTIQNLAVEIPNDTIGYKWSPNIGLNSTTSDTVLAAPKTTTIYTVSIANSGCSATKTFTVYTGNPIAVIAPNLISPICQGQTLVLTADTINSKGAPRPSDWQLPNAASLIKDTHFWTPEVSLRNLAPGTYSFVFQTSQYNCKSVPDTAKVTVLDSSNVLAGKVTFSNATGVVKKGNAVLFKNIGISSGPWPSIDTVEIDTSGNFSFPSAKLGQGIYVVGVFPDAKAYPQLTNGFYHDPLNGDTSSVFLWGNASSISITCNQSDTLKMDLPQIPLVTSLNGNATISGKITYGNSAVAKLRGLQAANSGVKAVPVGLGKRPDPGADIIEKTITDSIGNYQFINVPPGEYVIYAEIPGMPQDSAYNVIITGQTDTVIPNLNYMVNDTVVYIPVNLGGNTGITSLTAKSGVNSLTCYPNPFAGQATVQVQLANDQAHVTIEVFNLLGERVSLLHQGALNAGLTTFELDESVLGKTAGGVYLVKMQCSSGNFTQRLVQIGQ